MTIKLHSDYCKGNEFRIITHGNSEANGYIHRMTLNGLPHDKFALTHQELRKGGVLELWMSDKKPGQKEP